MPELKLAIHACIMHDGLDSLDQFGAILGLPPRTANRATTTTTTTTTATTATTAAAAATTTDGAPATASRSLVLGESELLSLKAFGSLTLEVRPLAAFSVEALSEFDVLLGRAPETKVFEGLAKGGGGGVAGGGCEWVG